MTCASRRVSGFTLLRGTQPRLTRILKLQQQNIHQLLLQLLPT